MDKTFWIHVGVEVFAFMGITLYFHRQNVALLSEVANIKAQMAEMSQRIATSSNPLLKRDDLFRQVAEMEQTMKTMSDYINTIKRQLQAQSQQITDSQGDIDRVKQRIVETSQSLDQTEQLRQPRDQVFQQPLIQMDSKKDEDGLPIMNDSELEDQIKSLED